MSINVFQPGQSLATRELLFIGFEGNFDANIRNFPYRADHYHVEIEQDAMSAFQWLKQRVERLETFQLPYGVLCKLQWLENNHFKLIELLLADPDLRYIPVIALSEQGDLVNRGALAQRGIDDCYAVPIEWELLEDRLEFLNQYKPKMLDQSLKNHPSSIFNYQTPLFKRLFDIVGAVIGILLTLPLWLSIALAIWIESKGPVIYKSKRVGAGYKIFDFYKFRSMYIDAETRLHEFQHLNRYNDQNQHPVFVKIEHDPRTTRVGRFIRKYSLDEIPQFINVLLGDMSLVGNRPLPLYEAEMLVKDEWCERFLAPAGLTGLWQVSKRGRTNMSMEERIALDIAYSRSATIWTDLTIIARTFGALVQKEEV